MTVFANRHEATVVEVIDQVTLDQLAHPPTSGVAFLQEQIGQGATLGMKPDSGDFLKWIRAEHSDVAVTLPPMGPKAILRSSDIWLPLVYLAGDTSVQIFLNMAASYLYDRAKGALQHDQPHVHLSIVYEDKTSMKVKRLDFQGNSSDIGKIMKKFDANNFFDDAT